MKKQDEDGKGKIDTSKLELRRRRPVRPTDDEEPLPSGPPAAVSAGPVDRVIELAFNPSREKLREVTIIDRMQGRLFPLMDTTDALFLNCIEIALYRQSPVMYKQAAQKERPDAVLDIIGELMYRTAQWQKSVAGKNLERATDIALAEMETRGSGDDDQSFGGSHGYED